MIGRDVILESPSMDLSAYTTATVDFSVYFWVGGGNGGPVNDTLRVTLSNNLQTEQVAVFGSSLNGWTESTINIHDYIVLTDNVKITFTVGDDDPGHIVEAMVDGIKVYGDVDTSNPNDLDNTLNIEIGPNPFADNINYTCNFEWNENMSIELMDINGRTYALGQLNQSGSIQMPNNIPSGNLIFLIKENDTILHKEELIRIK